MGSLNKSFEFFWKLSPQKIYHYITEQKQKKEIRKELARILKIPRYLESNAIIYGKKIAFVDSASFLYQFDEIFSNELYRFSTSSETPLIYDCGANIGLSVLYFKMLYPKSIVKAFEAEQSIAKILVDNVKKNCLENVIVENKAVWNNNCKINFGSDGSDGSSIFRSENTTVVDAIRLKDYLDKESVISLLKLDVEGAEIDILKDCKGSLNNVERIFIEYHSFMKTKQKLDIILKILTELSFKYFLQPISESRSPFINSNKKYHMDFQINIFAFK